MSKIDLIKQAENLYKHLSEEEKGFFDANLIVPKMKLLLFEFINDYVNTRNAILGKYKLIQEQIYFMRKKYCPECGNYLSFKDKDSDYYSKETGFLGHYKCSLDHRFMMTELPVAYLWKITDVVEGEIEK